MVATSVKDISEIDLNALLVRLRRRANPANVLVASRRAPALAPCVAAAIGVTRVSAAANELDDEALDALSRIQIVDDLFAFDPACLPGEKYGDDVRARHDHDSSLTASHVGHQSGPSYLDDPFTSRFENRYAASHEGHDMHVAPGLASHAAHREGVSGMRAQHASHETHQSHDGDHHMAAGHGAGAATDHAHQNDSAGHAAQLDHAVHQTRGVEIHTGSHASSHSRGHTGHAFHSASDHVQHTTLSDDLNAPTGDHDHAHENESGSVVASAEAENGAVPTGAIAEITAPDALHHQHQMTLAALDQAPVDDFAALNAPLL